jgi:hypothetical protein
VIENGNFLTEEEMDKKLELLYGPRNWINILGNMNIE